MLAGCERWRTSRWSSWRTAGRRWDRPVPTARCAGGPGGRCRAPSARSSRNGGTLPCSRRGARPRQNCCLRCDREHRMQQRPAPAARRSSARPPSRAAPARRPCRTAAPPRTRASATRMPGVPHGRGTCARACACSGHGRRRPFACTRGSTCRALSARARGVAAPPCSLSLAAPSIARVDTSSAEASAAVMRQHFRSGKAQTFVDC